MTVCFFGSYDPAYARNKILIDGLQKKDVEVLHCRSMAGSIFQRYPHLITQFMKVKNQIDVIYVAFVGHLNVPLAFILGKLFRKKVIFDMFYSMYDTYVFDRRSIHVESLQARSYWWIDKIAATLADRVITDTQAHAEYFSRFLHIPIKKFSRVFVGGDETVFKPRPRKKTSHMRVIFHGMFTRLHGAEYFVEAAKLLEKEEKIEMLLVGSSQNYPLAIELNDRLKPKNLIYYPEMPIEKLAIMLAGCDISVGHLGTTIKAKSVITNKMFQALASKVLVVAGDCPANRELFIHRQTAWFVEMGDPESLARAVKFLLKHQTFRKKIAANGYHLFRKNLTNEKIGNKLLNAFLDID